MIYLLGDVHGHFRHILPVINAEPAGPKTVIFLGDIEAQQPFEDEIAPLLEAGVAVWFIHGNHDTDSPKNWKNLQGSWHRNLHGRVVEIEGVRVAGLGGVFRGDIWYPDNPTMTSGKAITRNYAEYERELRTNASVKKRLSKMDGIRMADNSVSAVGLLDQSKIGRLQKHLSTIFPDTYDALADLRADILVTHEAPSCHRYGFQTIDALANAMGVHTTFHGHHHDSLDYSMFTDALGFKAFGVGLREILNLNGEANNDNAR